MNYEIWLTQGQGGGVVAESVSLKGALDFVEQNKGDGSFAIKYPDGTWHEWVDESSSASTAQ